MADPYELRVVPGPSRTAYCGCEFQIVAPRRIADGSFVVDAATVMVVPCLIDHLAPARKIAVEVLDGRHPQAEMLDEMTARMGEEAN